MSTIRVSVTDTTVVQIENKGREVLLSVLAQPDSRRVMVYIHEDGEATVQPADNGRRMRSRNADGSALDGGLVCVTEEVDG